MSNIYIAVIADAIDSRGLAPAARTRLQADLQHALPQLNQRYRKALAARFDVTLGDELQCLLHDAGNLWEISHDIRYQFPAVDWVVACGRGPITTALSPGITAPKVDGPCFHAARAALESAKRDRQVLTFAGRAPSGVRRVLLGAVLELDRPPACAGDQVARVGRRRSRPAQEGAGRPASERAVPPAAPHGLAARRPRR